MAQFKWRETAELIGISSIVASLIFVGLELRQSQKIADIDSSAIRAEWFFSNRASINENAEIWVKGNSGALLTDAEQVIFANIVKDINTNNRFTWGRERSLGDDSLDYAAHELAWILHSNPAALKVWEKIIADNEAMRSRLMPSIRLRNDDFKQIVRADLEKLAVPDQP